jgi:hypothetical protein
MGRLSTVDLLIKVVYNITIVKNVCIIKRSRTKVVSTRRSTVLSLSLQYVFLAYLAHSYTKIKSPITLAPAYSAFSEGWGLYCEFLGHELGVYEEDPFQLMGFYSFNLIRACRLVSMSQTLFLFTNGEAK